MAGFRDGLNTHLDDDDKWSVNLDEIEQLCQIIDLKDRQLLADLIHLKDVQLNQKQIATNGFKPDSRTVSSILVNEVLATAADQLQREKDYISDDIAQNDDETAKLRKIIAKYQDALARQQKNEKNAMDDLMLQ